MHNDRLGHASYLYQYPLGDYPFAIFFPGYPGYVSHQPAEQWGGTEDPVCTLPQPNLPAQSSPFQSTIRPLAVPAPKPQKCFKFKCSICSRSFLRWQERDRHELTHLPHFIHCPLSHCAWRGNRAGLFKKHWEREDHHDYHEDYDGIPNGREIETYDPWAVLNQFKSGPLTFAEAKDQANVLVEVKGFELQKTNIWTDSQGRSRKQRGKQASRLTSSYW
ncbi:hypothetical protein EI94DRAFT_1703454 [Lactarius quietus]|nr:hypothetical protein EI94DRAFT_1703454 [Lactarius quietus]